MTYYIEDLKPGMSESLTKEVSERDVQLFGEASGDMNPVHFDEAFAKTTAFGGRIAHGGLLISYLSAVLGMKMPGPGTVVVSVSNKFKGPVRIGDTVTATCTVREVFPRRRFVVFDCVCKVGEKVVVQGEALVMTPVRPQ